MDAERPFLTNQIESKSGESQERLPRPQEFLEKLKNQGLENHAEIYSKVVEIARSVKSAGGKVLLVGGSVRDIVMGKTPKDFDVEVYGLKAEEVRRIAGSLGNISEVGKAFGVLKLTFGCGLDIDIALPRSDSKIAAGHKGFEVKTNPFMSVEDAARRRDFTINAIAADPLTGEIHDPFGGLKDIKQRVLRVTDPERFADDPLRAMRAMQFVGRFGMQIDKSSLPVILETAEKLRELPKERIGEEWKKLLLKSEKPSLGLSAGMVLGIMKNIHPEFPPLAQTPQDKEWHPEGDAWVHTLMVVDEAARLVRKEDLDEEKSLVILLASLCHDLGKPLVTKHESGRVKSYGHESAGVEPTNKFLAGIGIDNLTRQKVVRLVANHMVPTMLYVQEVVKKGRVNDGAIRRLADRIYPATIQELVLVSEADHLGRGPFEDPEHPNQLLLPFGDYPAKNWLLDRARRLKVEESRPSDLVRGRDLINLGFKQGPKIGEIIALSNRLRDEKDFSREKVLEEVMKSSEAAEAAERLRSLLKG